MPRGRSTFTKRQKEQARQQKQRDKNERKTQRKQDQPEGVVVDEAEELRQMRAQSRRRCSASAATTNRILSTYSHRTASKPTTNHQASGGTGALARRAVRQPGGDARRATKKS